MAHAPRRCLVPFRRALGAGLVLAGAVLLAGALASPALAAGAAGDPATREVMVGPESDGSCETVPETYPGNGEPVPLDAMCAVVATDTGVPVAEVWAWRDGAGLHWYNYVLAGHEAVGSDALTMCASTDPGDAGLVYSCTTESGTLLFTSGSLFVTWPTEGAGALHFCEAVDVVDQAGAWSLGRACGTIAASGFGATPTPTQTPTDEPADPPVDETPASTPVPSEPPATTTAVAPPPTTDEGEAEVAPPPPADDTSGTPASSATTVAPTSVETPEAAPSDDTDLPDQGADDTVALPVGSEVVATVGDSPFPVLLVVLVALALGVGGVGVLAGPGVRQAQRRRH